MTGIHFFIRVWWKINASIHSVQPQYIYMSGTHLIYSRFNSLGTTFFGFSIVFKSTLLKSSKIDITDTKRMQNNMYT